jgi:hypothetical protein
VLSARVQFRQGLAREGKIADLVQGPLFFAQSLNEAFQIRVAHLAIFRERPELEVVGASGDLLWLLYPIHHDRNRFLAIDLDETIGSEQRSQGALHGLWVLLYQTIRGGQTRCGYP